MAGPALENSVLGAVLRLNSKAQPPQQSDVDLLTNYANGSEPKAQGGQFEEFFATTPAALFKPGDLARETYGLEDLKPLLREKFQRFLELRDKIPVEIEESLPSYRSERWDTPVPVHMSSGKLNVAGVYRSPTTVDPVSRIGLSPEDPTPKGVAKILEHEFTHALADQKVHPEPGKTVNNPRKRPRMSVESGFVSRIAPDDWSAGQYSIDPGETSAYLTTAIREFVRQTGRSVNSEEDVMKALDMAIKANPEFAPRFKLLKKLRFIGSLGQMLVKADQRKTKVPV